MITRSFCPGCSTVAAVMRLVSSTPLASTLTSVGPSNVWSMAAPMRSLDCLVTCTMTAAVSRAFCHSCCSGLASAADTRGSLLGEGSCSFASNSD